MPKYNLLWNSFLITFEPRYEVTANSIIHCKSCFLSPGVHLLSSVIPTLRFVFGFLSTLLVSHPRCRAVCLPASYLSAISGSLSPVLRSLTNALLCSPITSREQSPAAEWALTNMREYLIMSGRPWSQHGEVHACKTKHPISTRSLLRDKSIHANPNTSGLDSFRGASLATSTRQVKGIKIGH